MATSTDPNNVVDALRQSKPVDMTEIYDPNWVTGKTIIVTGGASGFGAGFSREWAAHGANIIVSDISVAAGEALVQELRKETSNPNHHFIKCDVTNWQSQVDLFKTAVKLSPTKAIDAVVANAGISGGPGFDRPKGLDAEEPPEPEYKVVDVNLKGVMYTAQLATFWLQKNSAKRSDYGSKPGSGYRPDRHLLLVGSVASLLPIPG
jgi:NAD(P)-dependent dehydrogenase (short-subunit alcohol dehydrogenase family)